MYYHYMYYFAYGMNCNLAGMKWRCPTAKPLGVAVIPNFELRFRYHADIQPSASCDLYGVLWEISKPDLESLDKLEGYPTYYDRHEITVWLDGVSHTAWVYQMTDQSYEQLPDLKYLENCLQGYADNFIPSDQIYAAYTRLAQVAV